MTFDRKAYMRNWYLRNREKRRHNYLRNRAAILRKAREYYRKPEVKAKKAERDKKYHADNRDARNRYARGWRMRNAERAYKLSLEWRKRNPEKFRAIQCRHSRKWGLLNPEKRKAHQRVADALRCEPPKLIKPKNCSLCKMGSRIEAHHPDYSKPLEVVWVCHPCHRMLEGRIGARNRANAVRLNAAAKTGQ